MAKLTNNQKEQITRVNDALLAAINATSLDSAKHYINAAQERLDYLRR